MSRQIVKNGKEPLLREAVAYLERRGIPASDIVAVRMDAEVNRPLRLSVDLYVSDDDLAGVDDAPS